ncbi:hypothetical protein D1007_09235 [Hordeum vulgare]|nr:hypothetical protein D1007_09235 [Hordeum vulgare]
MLQGAASLPANGTRGGLILLWDTSKYAVTEITVRDFSISAMMKPLNGQPWVITTVYGPHDDARRALFLAELQDIAGATNAPWLVLGDFNLITSAADKNNPNLDRRWMLRFRQALNASHLKEIRLIGRKFTWSNEQSPPTLVRLDRAFCTVDWELMFQNTKLLPQSSSMSNHCPLLLVNEGMLRKQRRFQFKHYWLFVQGFHEVVLAAWNSIPIMTDPIRSFNMKLRAVARALPVWRRARIGNLQMKFLAAQELILRLDCAQDERALTAHENATWLRLKSRCLGLAVLLRIKQRQRVKVSWLKDNLSSSKMLFIKAKSRARKSTIHSLLGPLGTTLSDQHSILNAIDEHFTAVVGTPTATSKSFCWDFLQITPENLQDIEHDFSLEEIKNAIWDMPTDKALGTDGFLGVFYRVCWEIIKADLLAIFQRIFNLNSRSLHKINDALIVLIPKKKDPTKIGDYRPISVIHSLMKLITKVLARRLAPRLPSLISKCQSAFMSGRSIQENFLYVENLAKHYQ